jgi:hypothetical protein
MVDHIRNSLVLGLDKVNHSFLLQIEGYIAERWIRGYFMVIRPVGFKGSSGMSLKASIKRCKNCPGPSIHSLYLPIWPRLCGEAGDQKIMFPLSTTVKEFGGDQYGSNSTLFRCRAAFWSAAVLRRFFVANSKPRRNRLRPRAVPGTLRELYPRIPVVFANLPCALCQTGVEVAANLVYCHCI